MIDFKTIKKGDLFSERANGLTTFMQALGDAEPHRDSYILTVLTDDNRIKTYTQSMAFKEQGPVLQPESFGETDTRNVLSRNQELVIDEHFLSEKSSFLKGLILRVATLGRISLDPKQNPALARILGGEDYKEVSRKHISTCSVIVYFSPLLSERLIRERSEGQHFFTGIGSRSTPEALLRFAETLSERLCRLGWGLRSGKAEGADSAFQRGLERCPEEDRRGEIFLPWAGFGKTSGLASTWDRLGARPEAEWLARRLHPAWEQCKESVRKLHTRNVYQVLGEDLGTPSKFVLYCAEERYGVVSGGTATAVNLARALGIPAINISHGDWKDQLLMALSGYPPKPVYEQRSMGRPLSEVAEDDKGRWLATVLSYLLACDYLERYRDLKLDRSAVLASALSLWHLINDPLKPLLVPKKNLFEDWPERLYPEWIKSLAGQIETAVEGELKPISTT